MEEQQPGHDEAPRTQYPTGRGYGHDYMRGGEVFGGYGYKERDEYRRTQGDTSGDELDDEELEDEPHELQRTRRLDGATGPESSSTDEQNAPVPHLEHTFGLHWLGGHSRSFYVTQAQLQQRIYGPRRDGDNGESENPSPS